MTIALRRHSRAAKSKSPYSTKSSHERKSRQGRSRRRVAKSTKQSRAVSLRTTFEAVRLEDKLVYPCKTFAGRGRFCSTIVRKDPEMIGALAVAGYREKKFQDEMKNAIPDRSNFWTVAWPRRSPFWGSIITTKFKTTSF